MPHNLLRYYVFTGAVVIGHVPDEQRLYTDLMQSYEPAVRPVLNASRTVIVNFRISLNQIVDLVIVPLCITIFYHAAKQLDIHLPNTYQWVTTTYCHPDDS